MLTWISLGLNVINMLATGLLTVALVRAWARRPITKDELDAAVADYKRQAREVESEMDDLYDRVKAMANRRGMRERRAEGRADDESFKQRPNESVGEWKLRCRGLINRGVKPNG